MRGRTARPLQDPEELRGVAERAEEIEVIASSRTGGGPFCIHRESGIGEFLHGNPKTA